jgi:hypothetical protein
MNVIGATQPSHQRGCTLLTLPKLPYEQPVYEGTVYPGTLTGRETVPTIGLVGPLFDRTLELVCDRNTRRRENRFATDLEFVWLSGEPLGNGNSL